MPSTLVEVFKLKKDATRRVAELSLTPGVQILIQPTNCTTVSWDPHGTAPQGPDIASTAGNSLWVLVALEP